MAPSAAAAIDAAVLDALASGGDGTPAAWVGVWSPDAGMHVAAYGEAAAQTPATLGDHNYIGSLTKTATAVAVLRLVEGGFMTLGDTVAELDPQLAQAFPEVAEITVEHLLNMDSGLPDYANEPRGVIGLVARSPNTFFSSDDLIRVGLAANEIAPVGTPGYSTTNYIILGELIEAVSGVSPEDAVTSVFADVGMTQSALLPPGEPRPEPASDGYLGMRGAAEVSSLGGPDLPGSTDVTSWSLSWGRAGGGAYSTIEDLGIWGSSGLGNSLLSESLGQARFTHTVSTPMAGDYGYGIMDYGDGWFGHSGQVIGWEAEVRTNPETGEVIAVMINSTSGLGDVLGAVLQALP